MITIQGNARKDGVAIAVVAVVDSQHGINGVSPHILEQGVQSIKRMLTRNDYPEVVVVCDNLVMGLSIKIPGINTIGIAAQTDLDIPGLVHETPTVAGLENLLDLVSDGNIIIVDGNNGVVHIDPDPHTLIHYQQIEEQREVQHKVFIASEHIPARTQTGHTVVIFAYITNEGEVDQALNEGADGLLLDLRGHEEDVDYYKAVMRAAPGKPLVFVVDYPCAELLRTAGEYSGSGQVTVMFQQDKFEELFAYIDPVLAELEDNPDAANVDIGTIARGTERDAPVLTTTRRLTLDLRKADFLNNADSETMTEKAATWLRGRDPEDVILLLGKRVDVLKKIVTAGARSICMVPDRVGISKYTIRSIGEDEEL